MSTGSGGAGQDREPAEPDGPGLATRLAPLAVAAALLGLRLIFWQPAWGSTAGNALWGFGLPLAAGALHLAAVRMPGRYAIEGAAWVATIIVGFVIVVLLIPAGGH